MLFLKVEIWLCSAQAIQWLSIYLGQKCNIIMAFDMLQLLTPIPPSTLLHPSALSFPRCISTRMTFIQFFHGRDSSTRVSQVVPCTWITLPHPPPLIGLLSCPLLVSASPAHLQGSPDSPDPIKHFIMSFNSTQYFFPFWPVLYFTIHSFV